MSGQYGAKPRKNPGIKGRNPHLKAMRRREAEERAGIWVALSPREQLESLERRPGDCKKQIARIQLAPKLVPAK